MNNKRDWTGNRKAPFVTNGCKSKTSERQENDFYATDPSAVQSLLDNEDFNKNIWEPAAGMMHISNVLISNGYNVRSSDIVDRIEGVEILDFLSVDSAEKFNGDIITNPPYRYVLEFAKKGLDVIMDNNKMAMLLKLTFLEGIKRKEFFSFNPPKKIYVFSKRISVAKNAEFDSYKQGCPMSFAWFIWQKGWMGNPSVFWI